MLSKIEDLIFEQPLNEQFRLCLRLEYLFEQLNRHCIQASAENSHLAVLAILHILTVIDRPDLRTKLLQVLTQQTTTLAQLEQFPQVDSTKLKNTLAQLDQLINRLHQHENKIAQNLRSNQFLNEIRLQLNSPGGACQFNTPAYSLWLTQPYDERLHDLRVWSSELELLMETIKIILQLTRDSAQSSPMVAIDGFYQQALDPNLSCQMIRIKLPTQLNAFPKISVGNHRISIRFYLMSALGEGQTPKFEQDVSFALSYCRL